MVYKRDFVTRMSTDRSGKAISTMHGKVVTPDGNIETIRDNVKKTPFIQKVKDSDPEISQEERRKEVILIPKDWTFPSNGIIAARLGRYKQETINVQLTSPIINRATKRAVILANEWVMYDFQRIN